MNLLAPALSIVLAAALFWLWVRALADLVWMTLLRPWTGALVTLALLLLVDMAAGWLILPFIARVSHGSAIAGGPGALAWLRVGLAVGLVPFLARWGVTWVVQQPWMLKREPFSLDLHPDSRRQVDPFRLEELRQRANYTPPVATPPDT